MSVYNNDEQVITLKDIVDSILNHKYFVGLMTILFVLIGFSYVIYRSYHPSYMVTARIQPAYTLAGSLSTKDQDSSQVQSSHLQLVQSSDQLKSYLNDIIDQDLRQYGIDYYPSVKQDSHQNQDRPIQVNTDIGGTKFLSLAVKTSGDNVKHYKHFFHHSFKQLKQFQQPAIEHLKNDIQNRLKSKQHLTTYYGHQLNKINNNLNQNQRYLKQLKSVLHNSNQSSQSNFLSSNYLLTYSEINNQLLAHQNATMKDFSYVHDAIYQLKQALQNIKGPELKSIKVVQLPSALSPALLMIIFALVGFILGVFLSIVLDQYTTKPSNHLSNNEQ